MKIIGNGLIALHEPEELKYFIQQYDQTPQQNIIDYETFRVTTITKHDYDYVVVLEAGGGVTRAFRLEGKDYLKFYSQLGLESCGISNTSGMGYIRAFQQKGEYDHEEVGFFCLDNSPYDIPFNDDMYEESVGFQLDEIRADLDEGFGEQVVFGPENCCVLFISQL